MARSSGRNVRQRLEGEPEQADAGAAADTVNGRRHRNWTLINMWYDTLRGICGVVALYNATQALVNTNHSFLRLLEGWAGGVDPDEELVEVYTLFTVLVQVRAIGGPLSPGDIGHFWTNSTLHYADNGEIIGNPGEHPGRIRTIEAGTAIYHLFLLTPGDEGGAEERVRFENAMENFDYGFLRLHVMMEGKEEAHFLAVLRRDNSYFINTGVVNSPWYRCRSLAELFYTHNGRDTLIAQLSQFYSNVRFGDYTGGIEASFWFPKVYLKPSNDWTGVAVEARTVEYPLVTVQGQMPPNAERAVKFDGYEDTHDLGL